MTYARIVRIFPALKELRELKLTYTLARGIHVLCRIFEDEYSFFAEEEGKLAREFAVKGEDGEPVISEGGKISFADFDAKRGYMDGINQLYATEVQLNFVPVTITAADMGGQCITADIIGKLDGVVNFE